METTNKFSKNSPEYRLPLHQNSWVLAGIPSFGLYVF